MLVVDSLQDCVHREVAGVERIKGPFMITTYTSSQSAREADWRR